MKTVLSKYTNELWERGGKMMCAHCGEPVYCDWHSGGYWLHLGFDQIDGANGLYCNPEMWKDKAVRENIVPVRLAEWGRREVPA